MSQQQHVRWPRLVGEGQEPTSIFVRRGSSPAGDRPRGPSPSVMERALVARMVRELTTPPLRRRAVPPPLPRGAMNPFLVPPEPGDPPPPWEEPPAHVEERATLAAEPEARRSVALPLLLFLASGAAVFAWTVDPALLAAIVSRGAHAARAAWIVTSSGLMP